MAYRYSKFRKNNDPRVVPAKYESTCAETGDKILKGESCLYYPAMRKVYSLSSKTYETYCGEVHDMRYEDDMARSIGLL